MNLMTMDLSTDISASQHEIVEGQTTPNVNSIDRRWKIIDFGLIPKFLKLILVNISDKVSGIITILITSVMSFADTVSDLVVAFTLIFSRNSYWGFMVILIDYIPSWEFFRV